MTKLLFDFNQPNTSLWQPITDGVMGGCSTSQCEILQPGGMRFSGAVSLKNKGGFASLRSPRGEYDLTGMRNLTLDLLGDGKSYKLLLRCDVAFDSVSYQQKIITPPNQRVKISLPLDKFFASWHGIRRPEYGTLDPSNILSFGLLIAEGQVDSFELLLYSIHAEN